MYIHRTHTQVDEAQSLVNVKRRNECVFKKRNKKKTPSIGLGLNTHFSLSD